MKGTPGSTLCGQRPGSLLGLPTLFWPLRPRPPLPPGWALTSVSEELGQNARGWATHSTKGKLCNETE